MLEFMHEGGWGMWPILLSGLAALLVTGQFAARPDAARREFLRALDRVVWMATIGAWATNVATVFRVLKDDETTNAAFARTVAQGLWEASRAPLLGFAFLLLTATCVAVGERRLAAHV